MYHWTWTTITGALHADQYIFLIIPHSLLLGMTNVSDKSCREHQHTHFMLNNLFQKSCRLPGDMEKVCRTRQSTDNNMAHAHCMLDTWGYKYIVRICNSYLFCNATMVAQTHLSVTLYIHCLSCLVYNRLGVYIVMITSWSSSSIYSWMGGFRALAQLFLIGLN
jgi:hypothetical protein